MAAIRGMRERYQQAFPVRSKLGIGQPSAILLGEDQPRPVAQAEQNGQSRGVDCERHSREVESSPWLRLQASELGREPAADRIVAKLFSIS